MILLYRKGPANIRASSRGETDGPSVIHLNWV